MDKLKRGALLIGLPVMVALAGAYLLTGIFGPSDWGVRCVRSPVSECQVLQTRFFGIFGNSHFAIPESTIHGARTVHPLPGHVGGRSSVSFTVALILDPEMQYPIYPVLSYRFQSQADAATERLNAYFNDRGITSIEIMEDLLDPALLAAVAPLLIVGVVVGIVLGLRRWRLWNQSSAT